MLAFTTKNMNFSRCCSGAFDPSIIEIKEAYKRIQDFIKTDNFGILSVEEQMDIMAFLITMKNPNGEREVPYIVEEDVQKELRQIMCHN